MSSKPGIKGYVKTAIFFTTYNSELAKEIINNISRKYKILESHQSRVLKEVYYVAVEGDAKEVEGLLKGKVEWYKVDVLTFR